MILQKIEALRQEIENLSADTAAGTDELYVKYLSKKGSISLLMAEFRNVPAEQKREVGVKINVRV